jgi:hypothetical protein
MNVLSAIQKTTIFLASSFALVLNFSCKMRASQDDGKESYVKNLSSDFRDNLLQLNKARIGLYPTISPQYCKNHDNVGREYHLKSLDDHSPFAPLYGRICIDKRFENATFFVGGEDAIQRGHIKHRVEGQDIIFEALSDSSSGCFVDNKNWIFEAREFSVHVVKRFLTMDWSYRDTLVACAFANDVNVGQELQPIAFFRKRWFPTALVANEEWSVVSNRDHSKILAKIWTNPVKWSWAVEDLQEAKARLIRPEILFLLPVMNEMRRRLKETVKANAPIENTP